MKKRILCLLLCLLVLVFSACGTGDTDTGPPPADTDNDIESAAIGDSSAYAEEEEEVAEPESAEPEQDTENEFELVGLMLLGHDLTNSSSLESHILTSPAGEEHAVTVITGGFGHTDLPSEIFWECGAITIFSTLWYDTEDLWFGNAESARDLVASRLMEDMSWLGRFTDTGGISLTTHIPFHVSADNQTAFVGFGTEVMGESVLFLYFAEAIADSAYLLSVELFLHLDDWSEEDTAILEELSRHMGFDLTAYLP